MKPDAISHSAISHNTQNSSQKERQDLFTSVKTCFVPHPLGLDILDNWVLRNQVKKFFASLRGSGSSTKLEVCSRIEQSCCRWFRSAQNPDAGFICTSRLFDKKNVLLVGNKVGIINMIQIYRTIIIYYNISII